MSINPKLLSRLAIVPPASAALVGLVVLAGRWMTGLWADWSLVWQMFALYVVIGLLLCLYFWWLDPFGIDDD